MKKQERKQRKNEKKGKQRGNGLFGSKCSGASHFLLNLESVNNGCKFAEDFICFLVEFELGGDQVCKVAERFGGVKDLFVFMLVYHVFRLRKRGEGHTFFMTPTASSV